MTSDGARHAPPSAGKPSELVEKVLESWDRAAALSRAGLERKISTLLMGLVPFSGTSEAVAGALSRATLEP